MNVRCIADWIFTHKHLKNGDITDENIYFEDCTGNKNHIELKILGSPHKKSTKSGILQFVTDDGEEGVYFQNNKSTGYGKFFRTIPSAPINSMKFEHGYTIQIELKLPPRGQRFDPWMGILSRSGSGKLLGKTHGEIEILAAICFNDSFQWTWYPLNKDTNFTCWSCCADDLSLNNYVSLAIKNDGMHTKMYLNGVSDIRNPSDELRGIELVGDGTFTIGVSYWDNLINAFFTGVIRRIRIYDGEVNNELMGVYTKKLFSLNGTNEALPLKSMDTTDTIAIIPDSQYMGQYQPCIVEDMIKWCAEQKDALHIKSILHVGDISEESEPSQFESGIQAFSYAKKAKIPFMVTAGNHDSHSDCRVFLEYFGSTCYTEFKNILFDDDSGSGAIEFDLSGKKIIAVNVNAYRLTKSLAWCKKIIIKKNLPTIIFSHDVYYGDKKGGVIKTKIGTIIFDTLVHNGHTIFMVIAGHHFDIGHAITKNTMGKDVLNILTNYQTYPNGGNGYLQLAEFDFTNNRFNITTYSPWVAHTPIENRSAYGFEQLVSESDRFSLDFDFSQYFKL